jgi:hypothetical protein
VSFPKPRRNETSPKQTWRRPETHADAPLTSLDPWSRFLFAYGSGRLIDKAPGFRADEEHEQTGLGLTVHAETAYDHGVLGHGAPVTSSVSSTSPTQKAKAQA